MSEKKTMTKKDYQSLLVIVLGFFGLGWLFQIEGFTIAGFAIGVLGLLSSVILSIILKGWEGFAKVLGWINSRILLSVVFYLVLLPVALLSRIGKKDKLKLRKQGVSSFFTTRNLTYTRKDLENIW